ncbi:MAG: C40 family peptidase [Spirochaetaceae bacterium]|jgi:hypothetical protein|nr:C40 family peptidase [Spirochaetaceae bacterium]
MKKTSIACLFAVCLFLFFLPLLRAQEAVTSTPGTEGDIFKEAAPLESVSKAEPSLEMAFLNAAAPGAAINEEDLPELDIETLLRRRITETAQEYLGVPYRTGGATPEGFDCSGLVFFVFREAGMEVSRSTVGLWNSGKKITLDQVRPGDVLVFTTVRSGASHAGIVLENGPQGVTFIHAASQGSKIGVIISNMNEKYYKTRFLGARNYF